MRDSKGLSAWVCPLLIALFFFSLFFLPALLTKKNFQLPVSPFKTSQATTVPLDEPLRLTGSPQKTTTLREILSQNPQGILVNFWATWCAPCLEEIPSLEYLARQLNQKPGLPQLYAISEDESIAEVPKLFSTLEHSISFHSLHDPTGQLAHAMGTSKFPETYWLNSKGEVRYKWIGPQNWLSSEVLAILAARGQ